MIDKEHPLPVTKQAKLLGLARSTVYYRPVPTSSTELAIMAAMDEIHTKRPFYGIRRIRNELLKRAYSKRSRTPIPRHAGQHSTRSRTPLHTMPDTVPADAGRFRPCAWNRVGRV
jgi:hypothetical protein